MKKRHLNTIFIFYVSIILSLFMIVPVSIYAQIYSQAKVLKIYYSGAQSGYLEPCG